MGHDLIFSWFGLPAGDWPPDHYRLLGLEPGEADVERIERQVQQRLDAVRRYQLTHPEPATEAMNRLAQAFVCLTDPRSKQDYDARLLGRPAVAEPVGARPDTGEWIAALPPLDLPTSRSGNGPLVPILPAERASLPPLAVAPKPPSVAEVVPIDVLPAGGPPPLATASPLPPAAVPLPPPLPAPAEPIDPLVEAAQQSPPARRGLGTKRALYHRIARTRQLLDVWRKLGRYLGSPRRRLTRPAEGADLIEQLADLEDLLVDFPPLICRRDKPGCYVVALAQVPEVVQAFQSLSASQRETLARDWNDVLKVLTAHRDFLRNEARALRKRGLLAQGWRVVHAALTDQPEWLVLLVALVALNLVVWRTYGPDFFKQFRRAAPAIEAPEPTP